MTIARALLRCPIQSRPSERLRVRLPWIEADFFAEDESGSFRPVRFRVDCGAMLTRIPEPVARAWNLPVAAADAPITLNEDSAAGIRPIQVRRGLLLVRFTPHEPALPFPIPVQYVLTPTAHGRSPANQPALLGLAGVVDQMTWLIDGRQTDNEPDGSCILTDTR